MKRLLWALGLMILAGASTAHADSVVLIVAASSPMGQLSSVDLRKAFMGFDVVLDGVTLRAARNRSDPRLENIFLQNVVNLTELVYERQIVSRKLEKAAALPLEFFDQTKLLDAVARDPSIVSYTWATVADKRSDVRVVRTLWHD